MLLKGSNDFISGEKIGSTLFISRAAVCKNISALKKEGYNIESATNKGYLLIDDKDIVNKFELESRLKTEFIGKNCLFYSELTSTNDQAKKIVNENTNIENGTVVITEKQTNGKGRQGRNWVSPEKSGVYFSIILKPNITPMETPQITLITGIAVANAINKITKLKSGIKWPNDVIINGKKVCGILTEMTAEVDKVKYVIVGIGINVNNDKFENIIKDKATSLKIESGINLKRADVIAAVIEEFEVLYKIYADKKDFSLFIDRYKKLCLNMNKQVKAVFKDRQITGTVCDIGQNGQLIIKTSNDTVSIISGEVSLTLKDGKYI